MIFLAMQKKLKRIIFQIDLPPFIEILHKFSKVFPNEFDE